MKSFNQFLGERTEDLIPERQRLNLGVSPGQQSLPGMGKRSGQEKPVKKPQYNPKYYNADGTLKPNAVQTYIQGRAAKEYNRPGVKLTPETKARIDAANATFASAAKGDKKAAQQVAQWTKEFEAKHGLMNKPEAANVVTPSPKSPTSQQALRDIKADKPRSGKSGAETLQRLLGSPQRPNPVSLAQPAPAPTAAQVRPRTSGPKVTTNTSAQSWQGPTKAAPTKTPPAPVKPPVATKAPVEATPSTSSKDLAKQIGKEVGKTLDTNRAATRAASTRAWTKAGKGLGILGAGLEGKYAYDTAKAAGASTKRAVGAGLARAAGGLLGAAVGAVGGSVAGPVGSIAGGTLGYTQGADKATKLYNRITGDPNKKVTTQSVIRNVGNLYREKVPTSVRAKVPEGVKRTFKDFMLKAGRQYGNWQRSQSRQEA